MLGLLGYAVGALAMVLAQGLTAIIVFWAVVGGIGASLLLPSMQSLIHGNFEGPAQRKAYALVGAAAAIAAAVGPLLGGFALGALVWWLLRRKRQGKATLLDPDLFRSTIFRFGISQQMLQQIALGGSMIALPIYLLTAGLVLLLPIVPRADSGWWLVVPLMIAGSGLGLLVSQLNNYTLAPISEERVSEAAGVNSAAGSFGLSFGLAFAGAIMLATLSVTFTDMAQASKVLPPDDKQQVAQALEDDAQVLSNTQLEEQLAGEPEAIQAEIIRINTDARPLALQVALLVPIIAGLIGSFDAFRMMRLPDVTPSGSVEGMALG